MLAARTLLTAALVVAVLAVSHPTAALPVAGAPHVQPEVAGKLDPECEAVLPPNHATVRCAHVPRCNSFPSHVTLGDYQLDDGSGPAVQQTLVELCHDHITEHLRIKYIAFDNNVISNMSLCGDQVWEEDALEFMAAVASTAGNPTNYSEIDISPLGALWAGAIHNPSGLHPVNTTMIGCTSGIEVRPFKFPLGWGAELTVPLEIIVRHSGLSYVRGDHPKALRANFYRTDTRRGTTGQEFSGWNPTYATPPDFHVPKYFGVLLLK